MARAVEPPGHSSKLRSVVRPCQPSRSAPSLRRPGPVCRKHNPSGTVVPVGKPPVPPRHIGEPAVGEPPGIPEREREREEKRERREREKITMVCKRACQSLFSVLRRRNQAVSSSCLVLVTSRKAEGMLTRTLRGKSLPRSALAWVLRSASGAGTCHLPIATVHSDVAG